MSRDIVDEMPEKRANFSIGNQLLGTSTTITKK